jgi:hypothetical protein
MVWNYFFKLNKKTFKKNKYEFNHMIRTDGISICVLFVLLENGKPMSKAKGKKLKGFLDSNYIENVKNINDINKKFVVADPFFKMKILFQLRNNIFTIFDPQ